MSREALIVVDMCNDFVADDGLLTVGKPAQEIVPYILEECKKADIVVFATDNHVDGKDGNWPPHCDPKTNGADLYGPLKEFCQQRGDGRKVWYQPKTKYNAFWETSLSQNLLHEGVDTVKLVGVCTDICVFNTAAGAYFAGFKVKVLKRGCATLGLDDFQKNIESAYRMMQQQFGAEIVE